ncbi:MAG: hypothetical protein AAFR97_06395, partial [Bacteroidota bacterium]
RSRSSMFLPWPGDANKYILFHRAITFVFTPSGIEPRTEPLYYSIISFEGNSSGEVLSKNVILYDGSPRVKSGRMTANKHANGIDWWIINQLEENGGYLTYLLTESGLEGPFIQELTRIPPLDDAGMGAAVTFSSDGTKYVYHTTYNGTEIYSFDRETGELFLNDTIENYEPLDLYIFSGAGLSPNGRFLYISDWVNVYQYDLDAVDIEASAVVLHTFTNPDSMLLAPHSQHFQLGPDCKLYNYMNSGRYIHRINQPDLPGLACDYEVNAIFLPFSAFRDQPQFPHFRLGPVGDEGSPCVEGPLSTTTVAAPTANLKVYPNPGTGPIRLFLPSGEAPAQWRLFDLQGRPLYELDLLPGQHQRVDLSDDLPTGAYLWQLVRHGQVVEMGRVVR